MEINVETMKVGQTNCPVLVEIMWGEDPESFPKSLKKLPIDTISDYNSIK